MRQLRGTAVLLLALALVTPAVAAAKVRLGTIDMKRAFSESQAGRNARDRLKTEFDAKQKKLDAAQEEIKKLIAQGQNEQNQQKREAIGKQIDEKGRALQETYKKMQRDLDEAEKAATTRLVGDIKALIPAVAQAQKLSAVVEGEGTYFTDPDTERVDITAEVVKRLDAKTPKTPAKAPPAPAKGPKK